MHLTAGEVPLGKNCIQKYHRITSPVSGPFPHAVSEERCSQHPALPPAPVLSIATKPACTPPSPEPVMLALLLLLSGSTFAATSGRGRSPWPAALGLPQSSGPLPGLEPPPHTPAVPGQTRGLPDGLIPPPQMPPPRGGHEATAGATSLRYPEQTHGPTDGLTASG